MIKLCEHIQSIYESEIKKGNHVTMVENCKQTQYCHVTLAVFMEKVLEDGYESHIVEKGTYHDYRFPFEKYYFCKECGCYISGPMEEDQQVIMEAHRHTIDPRIIATPENVYWLDDDRYNSGFLPLWKDSDDMLV